MPNKPLPPEWYFSGFGIFWTILAGVLGAILRQIVMPHNGWINRVLGWIGGAICSFYITPILTHAIRRILTRYDLVDYSAGLSDISIAGLAGLLSGAFGITVMETTMKLIKKKFGDK